MRRAFLIDEILLNGVSGEVSGQVLADRFGWIEQVEIEGFYFLSDRSEEPVELSETQRLKAIDLVEQTIGCDPDLFHGVGTYFGSAGQFAQHAQSTNAASETLASYLESPQPRPDSAATIPLRKLG